MDPVTIRAIRKHPDRAVDIANSYDPNKVDAKKHLVQRLKKHQQAGSIKFPLQRIYIVGGWYGNILIPLLQENLAFEEIQLIDIDEEALAIARNIFFPDEDNIKYIHEDATTMWFRGGNRLVINTSAEHMAPLDCEKIAIAIQSNDYYNIDDHTHCVDNVDQLESQYRMEKTLDKIEKRYYTSSYHYYKRFTLIGRTKFNENNEQAQG